MKSCKCLSHNGFLTVRGYEDAQRRGYSSETVDMFGDMCYVDSRVSVSGLRRDEDMYALISDVQIDEQARRFHNGS